jgi:predicted regulator of Ras-like GTPase activity (Roadblock/LC7/MglB family)
VRREDLDRVVAGLKGPMAEFVAESRVRTALLVSHSGQVLAQHGFTRPFDLTGVAALAAATHVSANALAGILGAGRWVHLHNAGSDNQLFLAPFGVAGQELVLVAIFDSSSTLGLVQLFFDRLVEAVGGVAGLVGARTSEDAITFERDLEDSLQVLLSEGGSREAAPEAWRAEAEPDGKGEAEAEGEGEGEAG